MGEWCIQRFKIHFFYLKRSFKKAICGQPANPI